MPGLGSASPIRSWASAQSIKTMTPTSTRYPLTLPPVTLWPAGAPGALGKSEADAPTLTPWLPDPAKATGASIVICPGGGYGGLADHEGAGYAEWLAENGIAGIVLKYRLGSSGYRHPAMLNDAARAIRLVRSKASEWQIDSKRVGIMGSSAGGHLASTLLTHFDQGDAQSSDPIEKESSRPDLGILCYAVITLGDLTHTGSRDNLLGSNPPPELVEFLSGEKQVTNDTPPCFIWHTWQDGGVPAENSIAFAMALRKKAVAFELHVYELGGHGLGLGGTPRHRWAEDCLAWLRERGFAKG